MGIDFDSFMNDENREKILRAVRGISPDFPEQDLKPDLILKNIGGWDSMNSVNFIISLEEDFHLTPGLIDFSGEESLADVILELQRHIQ